MSTDMMQVMESLRVLLFGMAGIFVVMGVIICTVLLLKRFAKGNQEEDSSN